MLSSNTYTFLSVRTLQAHRRVITSRQILIRCRPSSWTRTPFPTVTGSDRTAWKHQHRAYYKINVERTYLVHQAVSVVFASKMTLVHSTEPKSHVPRSWSSIVRSACIESLVNTFTAFNLKHGRNLRLCMVHPWSQLLIWISMYSSGASKRDSLSIAGSNTNPPPNGFCPAALPCWPGVTTQLLYHLPDGISSEKTFLTVSPGQTSHSSAKNPLKLRPWSQTYHASEQ